MTRTDVGWMPLKDQLVLVKRSLYDLVTVMTLEEFNGTEPSVEAVAVIDKNGVVPVFGRHRGVMENYYPVGKALNDKSAPLFSIPIRKSVEDFE